jgi:hypothetical protein
MATMEKLNRGTVAAGRSPQSGTGERPARQNTNFAKRTQFCHLDVSNSYPTKSNRVQRSQSDLNNVIFAGKSAILRHFDMSANVRSKS